MKSVKLYIRHKAWDFVDVSATTHINPVLHQYVWNHIRVPTRNSVKATVFNFTCESVCDLIKGKP